MCRIWCASQCSLTRHNILFNPQVNVHGASLVPLDKFIPARCVCVGKWGRWEGGVWDREKMVYGEVVSGLGGRVMCGCWEGGGW